MGEQIKIRVQLRGELADIRILMQHPMETGQRRDDQGVSVAARFIQTFAVTLNGKTMIEGQLNTSVSKNPLFAFKARGIKSGDRIGVNWTDNAGDQRLDEILVS